MVSLRWWISRCRVSLDSFKGFNLQETTPINGENPWFPVKISQRKPIQWAVWWLARFFRKKMGPFRDSPLYLGQTHLYHSEIRLPRNVLPGSNGGVGLDNAATPEKSKKTIRYHHRSNKETYIPMHPSTAWEGTYITLQTIVNYCPKTLPKEVRLDP